MSHSLFALVWFAPVATPIGGIIFQYTLQCGTSAIVPKHRCITHFGNTYFLFPNIYASERKALAACSETIAVQNASSVLPLRE